MDVPDIVLSSIQRKLREVERFIVDHKQFQSTQTLLEECQANLQRIQTTITPDVFNGVSSPIISLWACYTSLHHDPDTALYFFGSLENTLSHGTGPIYSPPAIGVVTIVITSSWSTDNIHM